MRSNITLFILLISGSVVFGQDVKTTSSQIQETGIQINDESLPPQSALYFTFQLAGYGEIENVESWQNLTEETSEKDHLSLSGSKRKRGLTNQEAYKSKCFNLEPGLTLKKLIFPFHFHT
ncbi:hypothetical protein ACKGJO_01810 [Gracilimonas sp. Q87]|uniref:hypothetical protein n=1 Tax=Gracilimonas sp. Q87 TaxID=3384766 RepID=UPI0039845396